MNFGICISTYQRKDGKTPELLRRALDSVFNQTYKNFKIFLIGDKYENNDEFEKILSEYPSEKIYYENLEIANERDFYNNKMAIWSYGGVNALNRCIDVAFSNNFVFLCHLDHDDWWYPNHLENIKNCIEETNADWICTKSTYASAGQFLPNLMSKDKYIKFEPGWAKLIHSSVCINYKNIPLKYRDLFKITGKVGLPADADLWERIKVFAKENNKKCILINELTCRHDEEGFERR
jgi:glycosyltransferase involved in cell wall biosynthesis